MVAQDLMLQDFVSLVALALENNCLVRIYQSFVVCLWHCSTITLTLALFWVFTISRWRMSNYLACVHSGIRALEPRQLVAVVEAQDFRMVAWSNLGVPRLDQWDLPHKRAHGLRRAEPELRQEQLDENEWTEPEVVTETDMNNPMRPPMLRVTVKIVSKTGSPG